MSCCAVHISSPNPLHSTHAPLVPPVGQRDHVASIARKFELIGAARERRVLRQQPVRAVLPPSRRCCAMFHVYWRALPSLNIRSAGIVQSVNSNMRYALVLLAVFFVPAGAKAHCYELWDSAGNIVYRAQTPPWPMSWPPSDTRLRDESRSRGEQLIVMKDKSCPREHIAITAQPTLPHLANREREARTSSLPPIVLSPSYRCQTPRGTSYSQVPCAPDATPMHSSSSPSIDTRSQRQTATLHGVNLGMTPDDVRRVLGSPRPREETRKDVDGDWLVWKYSSERRRTGIPITTRPSLILTFKDERLRSLREEEGIRRDASSSRSISDEEALEIGMSADQVRKRLGWPHIERQNLSQGSHWQYWSYEGLWRPKVSGSTGQRRTNRPIELVFVDGILIEIKRPQGNR